MTVNSKMFDVLKCSLALVRIVYTVTLLDHEAVNVCI